MTEDKFDTALREQIDALPKSRMPERDLWQGIERGISGQAEMPATESKASNRPHTAYGLYAVAASMALVAVLGWLTFSPVKEDVTGQQLIAALSQQHEAQKDALLVKFKDQPALTENWQQQLKELDDAALAIKAALEQDPDNIALLRMLQNVHQQQINLIERVHAPKWQSI